MKTDPIEACPNAEQHFGWAIVHDFIAHPLMAFSLWSSWALKFHNWTSSKAWPREESPCLPDFVEVWIPVWHEVKFRHLHGDVYEVLHPNVSHSFRYQAENEMEALMKAFDHFNDLASRFGGQFLPR